MLTRRALFTVTLMTTRPARIPTLLLIVLMAAPAIADRSPVRRGEAEEGRRGGISTDRVSRRPIEGSDGGGGLSEEEKRRKQTTKVIKLISPPRCGAQNAPGFRDALIGMQNPDSDDFYIEVWGNQRTYYVFDSVYYFLRSNREAYVTMFWIGPEGSVFIPFSNFKVEANRDHKLDPSNIIVEPVGHERWRVIATPEPHAFPCNTTDSGFVGALNGLQEGRWAAGHWDVESKVYRRSRSRLNR